MKRCDDDYSKSRLKVNCEYDGRVTIVERIDMMGNNVITTTIYHRKMTRGRCEKRIKKRKKKNEKEKK